jgi:succinate dehydrogenase / fumarate reductase membrane anchor subunit
MKHSDVRSPLAKVRGLGSAHDGTGHFIWQRITAIALIPLSLWFVWSILHLTTTGNTPNAVLIWFSHGSHAAAMVLMLLALFYHAKLGLQVVIEDYVHSTGIKFVSLLLNLFIMYGMAALSIIAVLKLHLQYIPQMGVNG